MALTPVTSALGTHYLCLVVSTVARYVYSIMWWSYWANKPFLVHVCSIDASLSLAHFALSAWRMFADPLKF